MKNGSRRRTEKARLRARRNDCWICKKPIDYSLPAGHPECFECDEYVPVSRYWLGGYRNATEAALDPKNLRATHRKCNNWRGNRMPWEWDEPPEDELPTSREW